MEWLAKNIITFLGGFLIEISTMKVHHKCLSGKHSVTCSPLYICHRSLASDNVLWTLIAAQKAGLPYFGMLLGRLSRSKSSLRPMFSCCLEKPSGRSFSIFFLNKQPGHVHSSRSCLSWMHNPKSLVRCTVSLSDSVPHPLKDVRIPMWRDAQNLIL